MSVDNSKFMTSKSIAYNDLTLWNYIKTYSNIFSTYKGNRLQGGSLFCYVFMSAFMFLRQKCWTLSSCRIFMISIGLDEKSPVRYWCISVTYQKYQHHPEKGHTGCVSQCFDHSELELLRRQNKSASLSADVGQHFSISITELLRS